MKKELQQLEKANEDLANQNNELKALLKVPSVPAQELENALEKLARIRRRSTDMLT